MRISFHPLQDLKPLNIMKVEEDWKLIDLDAAATIGEKAGLKSSTGYVPPELLILSNTGEASVRDPTQADALTADSSFDMWSFGALLYLLITGQTLFNNNTEDNLNNRDLLRLCRWNIDDLEDVLDNVHNRRGKHQPLGRDLLEKLLQPEASKRPKSFKYVLNHPFFTGENDGSDLASKAIIKRMEEMHEENLLAHGKTQEELKKQTDLLEAINERTINIETISDQTYLQLRKTERVLLRSMFEATEVTLPTSFVIMPSKIEPEGPSPIPTGPVIQLADDGSGIELGTLGAEVKEKFDKRKGWFDKVCNLGASISAG
jgi:serine/threonine protein kinase